ncbi:hypothetical protein [Actinoplanes subtropicus]|uniref:hypothetical protein n=1 Tax=Actinoplanes subtropicus TaxID=543632 RepID=UPI0004C2E941|nr:hypothetical protein [Actinoplanes subtropicus]
MHRLAHLFGAAALVALVAACGDTTTRNEGTAPAAPAGPTSSSSPSPAVQPVKATAADPAHLTIYPDHIGPLKIGMSLAAAKATGLIVVDTGEGASVFDGCVSAHWKGRPDRVWMVFNGKYGLRALDSFGDQKTAAGIRPGSTLAAVRRAYPHLTWRIDGDETPAARRTGGDALVDVVKGDGAHYRINIQNSKVTDVQLESDRPGCYE